MKVRGPRAGCIPGGTIKLVAATCSEHYSGGVVLLEPPEGGLPMGLLISPALVRVSRGTVYVPIVNVGTTDVLLFPRCVVGSLTSVSVVSLPPGVSEVKPGTVCSVSSQTGVLSVQGQLEAVDLSLLSVGDQSKVKDLLRKYQSVFSTFEGDLGCTDLISHDIPLLDDVPVRQRYRRVPPSDYEAVRAHINQLLETQVIRESCSPYASSIVLVKKKM